MKTLYLMRHATAANATPPTMSDFDRTLSGRGVIEARTVGRFMKANRMLPDLVHCSAALRTSETAQIVMHEIFGARAPKNNPDKEIYNAPDDKILAAIHAADPHLNSLMIIAHNPGISDLISTLGNIKHYCEPATLGVFAVDCDRWTNLAPKTVTLEKLFVPDAAK